MNWKLILRLSLLGLVMALGSISFIPRYIESALLLAMCVFYAWRIGQRTYGFRFVHGFILGIVNNLWFIAVDDLFPDRYLARHRLGVAIVDWAQSAHHWSPRATMSVTGVAVGLGFGVVIGVFAMIAGMMAKPHPIRLSGHTQS